VSDFVRGATKLFPIGLGVALLKPWQAIYEATDGRIGERFGWIPVLLLRTKGRKTGQLRTVALLYLKDGDRYAVIGSKGGSDSPPAWLLNLQADPNVEVQVGRRRFPARATVAPRTERARLWKEAVRVWPSYADYQSRTRREIPVVLLEPVRTTRSRRRAG
jgi:deazaflavin-dependent oxidoreductase (nitroreductase family)